MTNSRVLPTLAGFQQALKDYRRQELAFLWIFVGALIAGVVIMGIVLWLYDPPLHERQNLLLGFMAIFISGLIWGAVQSTRTLKRNTLLHCCRCSQALQMQSGIVIATGNCPHCGQRAIEIPDLPVNDEPLPPQMTRKEFQAALEQRSSTSKKLARLGILGFFVILVITAFMTNHVQRGNYHPRYFYFPPLVFVVLISPWLFWCRWRASRPHPLDQRLKCPNCNAELASNLVTASGKCQSCRRVVFTDSPDALAALKENPFA